MESWVKIGPLPGLIYAQMVAEVLDKEEVPYTVYQDGVSTAIGISGTNLAGNEAFILVPPEFEEKVRDLIEGMLDHI